MFGILSLTVESTLIDEDVSAKSLSFLRFQCGHCVSIFDSSVCFGAEFDPALLSIEPDVDICCHASVFVEIVVMPVGAEIEHFYISFTYVLIADFGFAIISGIYISVFIKLSEAIVFAVNATPSECHFTVGFEIVSSTVGSSTSTG